MFRSLWRIKRAHQLSPRIASTSLSIRPPQQVVHFSSRMSFQGPVQQHIERKVTEEFKPVHLEVANESHGRKEDESHFHVLVVSEKFENVPVIGRHRAVQALFTDASGSLKFHSLRITAKTPEQWEKSNAVAAAPKCTGKGDGRSPTDVNKL